MVYEETYMRTAVISEKSSCKYTDIMLQQDRKGSSVCGYDFDTGTYDNAPDCGGDGVIS
jgi:hypothetical protein